MNPEQSAALLQLCKEALELMTQLQAENLENGRYLRRTPTEAAALDASKKVQKFIADNGL